MSQEKWKEIERNLKEQESFVQTIMQQRERKSRPENNPAMDNILSTSIQQAKQKINAIETKNPQRSDRSFENLAHSREKREKASEESGGVAGAMRKLQEKISDLEKEKRQLGVEIEAERERLMQAEHKHTDAVRALEETRRKVKNLESTIFNDKACIREMEKKLESRACSGKSEELEAKLSNSQMMAKAQQQELENTLLENQNKQREIKLLQQELEEERRVSAEQDAMLKSLNKELELKVAGLQERLRQKDSLIDGLREEVKRAQMDKLRFSQVLEESSKQPESSVMKSEIAQEDLDDLRDKYSELIHSYRNLEERGHKDKAEAKNYRNKFWQLKEVVKEIVDKIQALPNGVTSQLRYLIIKANKIEAFSNDYYASTPTKSANKRSSLLNSTSRSKSKSKSKLKFEELNHSNHSARSMSKRSAKSNRSDSASKKTNSKAKEKEREKKVVWSKNGKNEQAQALEAEIQAIRKKYKELVMSQGRTSHEVSEAMREELNDLAILLQEKSEQLTKLKRKQ